MSKTQQTWAQSRTWALAATLGASALLAGCATGPNANPRDPLEPYNRTMFNINDAVDGAVFAPVATGYKNVTPEPVRIAVTNFFANIGDLWSIFNNALQLKGEGTYNSVVRFTTNTVLGLGGLIDVASEMDIERHKQDFGLTMARWGVPQGPYLVLPFFGPSSIRDTGGLVVDVYGYSPGYIHDIPVRNSLYGLSLVNKRANLLGTTSLVESAALDKYSFTRDAYLQLRQHEESMGSEEDETQWMNESAPEPVPDSGAKK
ncbi:MAG: VacJ family lipoprotein [Comamonas sp.]